MTESRPMLWRIRLYINPGGWASASALFGLRRACEDFLSGLCVLEILDFENAQEEARTDGVRRAPAAVLLSPGAARCLSGATWEPRLLAQELLALEPDHDPVRGCDRRM